jgi:hypothetical protein
MAIACAVLLCLVALPSRLLHAAPQSEPCIIQVPISWTMDTASDDADRERSAVVGRRLAVLLVDRSGSMTAFTAADGGKRWDAVLRNLKRTLAELERVSPGIEVEIRFFDNELDCLDKKAKTSVGPLRATLGGAIEGSWTSSEVFAKVDALGYPKTKHKERGGTALCQAVSVVSDDLAKRFASGGYEWGFFAVYSDGEDADSAPEFKEGGARDWQVAAKNLSRIMLPTGGQVVVVPVGGEAEEMVRQGKFAGFQPGTLANTLPKPPPPPCRVALVPRPGFVSTIQTGRLIRKGDVVTVKVAAARENLGGACSGFDAARQTRIAVDVVDGSPFRIQEGSTIGGSGGDVRLVATESNDAGAALKIELRGRAIEPDGGLVVSPDSVTLSANFRPAVAPPDENSWRVTVPKFVQLGRSAVLSVDNLDDRFRIEWSIPGRVPATGASVTHLFDAAGVVPISLTAVSVDGKQGKRDLQVEVVDPSFTIVTAEAAVIGRPVVVRADSQEPSATYRWEVGGDRFEGQSITVTPSAIGSLPIRCVATTAKGGFKYAQTALLAVKGEPRLVVSLPDVVREGDRSFRSVCLVADVESGSSVRLLLNGREVGLKKPEPSEGVLRATFEVPLSTAEWAAIGDEFELKGEVVGQNAADTRSVRVVPVEGLGVQLRSPAAGTVVPFGQNCPIELAISCSDPNDCALVEALEIRVLDAKGQSLLLGDGKSGSSLERAAPDFKFSVLPEASKHQSPLRIEARIKSSRLRPRPEWIRAGEIGLSLAKAQFTITAVDGQALATVAYKPITVKLAGIPIGESVGVRWSIDGRAFGGDEVSPTIDGLAPGVYRISASVTRADGSSASVGPTGLEVTSSLALRSGDGSLDWTSGDPPPATVEIVGDPRELSQVSGVSWTNATPDPTNPKVATIRFAPSLGAGPEALAPRTVSAVATFADAAVQSVPLTVVVTPAPAPPTVSSLRVTVGGASDSARTGGVLAHQADLAGVWSEKTVTYSFEPSDVARSRGIEPIAETAFPNSIIVDDVADGTWTVTYRLTPYGGGPPVEAKSTFVNLRQLDWVRFLAIVGAAVLGFLILGWLNSLNGGLRWQVRLVDERELKQLDQLWKGPTLWGSHSPRWSLVRKRAQLDLADLRTAQWFGSPKFSWIKRDLGGAEKGDVPRGFAIIQWSRNDAPKLVTDCKFTTRNAAGGAGSRVHGQELIPKPERVNSDLDGWGEPTAAPGDGAGARDSDLSEPNEPARPRRSKAYLMYRQVGDGGFQPLAGFIWAMLVLSLAGIVVWASRSVL